MYEYDWVHYRWMNDLQKTKMEISSPNTHKNYDFSVWLKSQKHFVFFTVEAAITGKRETQHVASFHYHRGDITLVSVVLACCPSCTYCLVLSTFVKGHVIWILLERSQAWCHRMHTHTHIQARTCYTGAGTWAGIILGWILDHMSHYHVSTFSTKYKKIVNGWLFLFSRCE